MIISSLAPSLSASNAALHPEHVAVVVRAPDVEHPVVAPPELVEVVGDVRREVGELSRRAAQHAILVVAERRRAQPGRALGGVDVTVALEQCDRLVDTAGLVQRAL